MSADLPSARLRALGLELPPLRRPTGLFVMARRHGDLLYLSGQGPGGAAGSPQGRVGSEIAVEEAQEHARLVTLNLLAAAEDALGSLDRVIGVIKVLGFVNADSDFREHPRVINGCSALLLEIFGPERGAHARSAIGAGSLPNRITVEIEMILACQPDGRDAGNGR